MKKTLLLLIVLILISSAVFCDDIVSITNVSTQNNKVTITLTVAEGCKLNSDYPIKIQSDSASASNIVLPKTLAGTFDITFDTAAAEKTDFVLLCQPCKNDLCLMPIELPFTVTPSSEAKSFSGIAGIAAVFMAGILLGFSPCVYPLIPITLGWFMSQKKKRAFASTFAYVFGISLIYSTMGVIAALTGSAFGSVMQSKWTIISIAALLVVFSLSMFGLYEFKAPRFVENKAYAREGIFGAFLMGLIFGLAAAPCTGPVVASLLLYVAQKGNAVSGFILFFVLSVGMSLPLLVLAIGSQALPKPGEWMNVAKKAGGILLLMGAGYLVKDIVPFGKFIIAAIGCAGSIYLAIITQKKRFFSMLFIMIALASLVYMKNISIDSREKIIWQPYSAELVTKAKNEKKAVIIDFTADWCGICKELERDVFCDKEAIETTNDLVRLRADGTVGNDKTRELEKKYSVVGYPTIIFLDKNGIENASLRIVGKTTAEAFIARVNEAKK